MKNERNKLTIGLLSLALILVCAVGGTVAWMVNRTDPVTNTFIPAQVTTVVEEKTDNGVKSDVKIQNTGDVDAYIRATVVFNYVDADGNISATVPGPSEYNIQWELQDWFSNDGNHTDGYYYYPLRVSPGETTSNLIKDCKPTDKAPEGLQLQVTIIAEGIQADGTDADGTPAVQLAWKEVTVNSNGKLVKIN